MKDNDLIWIRRSRGLPQPKVIAPNRCEHPWKVTNIDCHGRVFVCLCDEWVPWTVGHVMDFESFDEIFGSVTARLFATCSTQPWASFVLTVCTDHKTPSIRCAESQLGEIIADRLTKETKAANLVRAAEKFHPDRFSSRPLRRASEEQQQSAGVCLACEHDR